MAGVRWKGDIRRVDSSTCQLRKNIHRCHLHLARILAQMAVFFIFTADPTSAFNPEETFFRELI